MRRMMNLAGLATMLLALGLAWPPTTSAAGASALKSESRRYTSASGRVIEAEECWLSVPENRSVATSRTIDLHYVRLHHAKPQPSAPLVFLAGGPGQSATGAVEDPEALEMWAHALDLGDVVLLDQRGTRDPDLIYRWDGEFPRTFFTSEEAARAHSVELSRAAVAAITARGVDLRGYTTEESVADLEDLRRALGVENISLLAFSYGTHLALAYLRHHDDHVENAVMVGVEGPDHTMKLPLSTDTHFRRIAKIAATDPAIATTVPDLEGLLDRVERRLAAEPMIVELKLKSGPLEVPVGPFGLHLILLADIGDASDLPVFPRLLESIDRGEPSILAWFVRKRSGFALGVHGMAMMMDATSGASAERSATIAAQKALSRFGDVVNFPFPDVVPVWNPPQLAADFRSPVVSAARTLFITGELDWNAPPYQAEEVRWGFSNATHLNVANAGHEQTLWQNEDAGPVILEFLAGEDVDAKRITYPALRFIPLTGAGSGHPSLAKR